MNLSRLGSCWSEGSDCTRQSRTRRALVRVKGVSLDCVTTSRKAWGEWRSLTLVATLWKLKFFMVSWQKVHSWSIVCMFLYSFDWKRFIGLAILQLLFGQQYICYLRLIFTRPGYLRYFQCIKPNTQYPFYIPPMKHNLQTLDPESPVLHFFSSFLADLLIITSDLKSHAYQLIGLQTPPFKRNAVQNNIYSIMEACNRTYEDLRRTETLLRGHLRGKKESAAERDSIRESRLTAKNTISSANKNYPFHEIYSYKTFHQSSSNEPSLVPKDKNFTSRPQKHEPTKTYTDDLNMPVVKKQRERQSRLNESKSHGNLARNAEPEPVMNFGRSETQHGSKKNAVELIHKIRQELGLTRQ